MFVIDLIKERVKSKEYNPWDFYYQCVGLGKVAEEIVWAFDEGLEEGIREELCRYIKDWRYNPLLCEYVNSLEWLCSPGVNVEERAVRAFKRARGAQEANALRRLGCR